MLSLVKDSVLSKESLASGACRCLQSRCPMKGVLILFRNEVVDTCLAASKAGS